MLHLTPTAEAVPFPIDPELTPASVEVALAPRRKRVSLLREMLGAIEDATPGGQRYLMTKLLALFRSELARAGAFFSAREREVVERALAALELETTRLAPDAAAFERQGGIIVDVIALA